MTGKATRVPTTHFPATPTSLPAPCPSCRGCLVLCQRSRLPRDLGEECLRSNIAPAEHEWLSQLATGLRRSAQPCQKPRNPILKWAGRGGGESCVRLNWRRVTRSASHLHAPSDGRGDCKHVLLATRLPHFRQIRQLPPQSHVGFLSDHALGSISGMPVSLQEL
jgi:hypothetical protein